MDYQEKKSFDLTSGGENKSYFCKAKTPFHGLVPYEPGVSPLPTPVDTKKITPTTAGKGKEPKPQVIGKPPKPKDKPKKEAKEKKPKVGKPSERKEAKATGSGKRKGDIMKVHGYRRTRLPKGT